MDIKEILNSIFVGAENKDFLSKYDEKADSISELFIKPIDVETIKDKPILLLVDNRPHSLISIGFALRFSLDLPATIYAITEGFHTELLSEEADKYNIELNIQLEKENYELNEIEKILNKQQIGFVITNIRHRLFDDLIDLLDIPVFVTKIE